MAKRNWLDEPPRCCDTDADLVTGAVIYPHRRDLARLHFWRCSKCGAYTGTHVDSPTRAPKGRLADEQLRALRIEAHAAFDPLWRQGAMSRKSAYRWAARALDKDGKFHIGWASADELRRLVREIDTTFNQPLD